MSHSGDLSSNMKVTFRGTCRDPGGSVIAWQTLNWADVVWVAEASGHFGVTQFS